jgi:hypothetical protein
VELESIVSIREALYVKRIVLVADDGDANDHLLPCRSPNLETDKFFRRFTSDSKNRLDSRVVVLCRKLHLDLLDLLLKYRY